MAVIIILVGTVQVLGGVLAYLGAASAIHQILGAVGFGMGILSIALGLIINELAAIRKATEGQRAGYDEPAPDMSKWSQRDRDRYIEERRGHGST